MTSSPEPIEAVLFDFGGVIIASPFEAFTAYERERSLPDGFLRRLNATNPDTNAWAQLERGQVDIGGFALLFETEAAQLGHAVDAALVLELLHGQVRPEMVEALRRIKSAGLRLALLTNNFVLGQPVIDRHSEGGQAMGMFDCVIESSVIGHRKPDPDFYRIALKIIGVEPRQAVFLDDLGVNLKPARALGMHTIKVVDPATALAELETLLGFPLS